jgi:hypothetical protein
LIRRLEISALSFFTSPEYDEELEMELIIIEPTDTMRKKSGIPSALCYETHPLRQKLL